jgi:hypothetical protein
MRNLLLRNLPGKASVLGLSPAKLPTRKKKPKKKPLDKWVVYLKEKLTLA